MPGESEFSVAELMRTLNRIDTTNRDAFGRIEARLDKLLPLEVFQLYQETTRRELTEIHSDMADLQAASAKRAAELEAGSKERNAQVNNRLEVLETKHDNDVASLRHRMEQAEAAARADKNDKAKLYITAALGVVASIVIAIVSKGLGV